MLRRTALGSAPWTRAPLLVRAPAVVLAIVVSAAVLSVAAGSGVLFLASTSTGALHSVAARECPEAAEPSISNTRTGAQLATAQQEPAAVRLASPRITAALTARGLPAPTRVALTETALPQITDPDLARVMLFARSGALDHVQVVASAGGHGVWIPQSFARATHTRPGTELASGGAKLRVAGVYRDLAPSAFLPLFELPRYWCTWSELLVPTPFSRPDPFFLTDLPTLSSAAVHVDATWYVPGDIDTMTVPQARQRLGVTHAALAAITASGLPDYRIVTDLDYQLDTAGRVRHGLGGPVVPIDVAGVVVALLLVAAAGQYWAQRRRVEIRLLAARGVHPAALGLKAALETAPATLLGATLGWLGAVWLVRTLGPAPEFEPGAPVRALALCAGAAAAGIALIALIGVRAGRGALDRSSAPRRIAAVPWEVGLLAASAIAYVFVRRDGAARIVHATVQVNPMVFAFPLLAMAGIVALVARGTSPALRRLAARSDPLPNSVFLALKRMAGTPAIAIGVIVGVALPAALLLYSSALTNSTSADVTAKNDLNVGAPDVFGTLARPGSTPDMHGHGAIVSFFQDDVGNTTGDGQRIQVLGLDPASFVRFAHGGTSWQPYLDRLDPTTTRRADALLVNAPSARSVDEVHLGDTAVPVRIVDRLAGFPGLRDPYEPMLVMLRSALTHVDPSAERVEQVWTTDDQEHAALAALRASGTDANYLITTSTFLDNSGLRPVTWIFDYLRSLAYLVGVVALTGLTLALAARARQHALDYHLARRMGLTRRQNAASLTVELGTLAGFGCAVGIGCAAGAVALVYQLIDLYRSLPPPPVYPVPTTAMGYVLAGVVVATGVGAIAVQHWYDRTNPAMLLRES